MQRISQTFAVLAVALISAAFAAHAQTIAQPKPNGKMSLQATVAPAIRDDIRAVNAAILQLIQGKPLPEGAEEALAVPKSLKTKLRMHARIFGGYAAPQISIMGYRHDEDLPIRIMITEGLHLQDRLGRRMLYRLNVTYLMTPSMVVIEKADIETWYPLAPRLRLFCVPAGKIPSDLFKRYKKHTDLLAFLDTAAYSRQQLQQGWEGGPRSVYLFVCTTDRLGPGAELSMRLGLPNGKEVGGAECMSANYEGYAVTLLRGKLSIPTTGLSANVYIKHGAYAPADKRTTALLGRFPLWPMKRKSGPKTGGDPTATGGKRAGLAPVADNHVYAYSWQNWNKANWGKYNLLTAGWHPTGGEKRIYMKFDLSNVKLRANSRVTLRLYQCSAAGSAALKLGIHRVTGAWSEGKGTYPSDPKKPAAPGELTWATQPTFVMTPSALFKPHAKGGRYVEVDITPLVRQWLAGEANHGLMIAPTGSLGRATPDCNYGFYSREEKDATRRPVLIIRSVEGDTSAGGKTATDGSGAGGDSDAERGGRLASDDPRVMAAYDRFVAAHNRLTGILHAGKGGTKEYNKAHAEYVNAKAAYNKIFSRTKPPKKH